MFRLLVIAVISTFLLIPIAGYSSNIIKNETLLIITSVTTGYVIVPAILLKWWPATPPRGIMDTMYETLIKGNLAADHFTVQQAIALAEVEDEGLHYLLAVDTDKTLYLSGQYLYDPVERGDFPSTGIHVYRDRQSDAIFGIDAHGSPLPVRTTLPFRFSSSDINPWLLDDWKLLDNNLDTVVHALEQQQHIG